MFIVHSPHQHIRSRQEQMTTILTQNCYVHIVCVLFVNCFEVNCYGASAGRETSKKGSHCIHAHIICMDTGYTIDERANVATAAAVPGLDANNSYSSISNTINIVMCQQILPVCKVASAETVSSAPSCYKLHDSVPSA
jgi:hypothetical protein